MSWYADPQLFIFFFTKFSVYRVTIRFGTRPVLLSDLQEPQELSFSKHLSLGDNKESDYDAFKASFRRPPESRTYKLINCQGLVINWPAGTWSVETPNSPFWSLPGVKTPHVVQAETEGRVLELKANNSKLEEDNKIIKKEKEGIEEEKNKLKELLEKRVSDLEAENAILRAQVNKQRDEKIALINGLKREDTKVSDLTSKLVQCCGRTGSGSSPKGPWISGHTIPSNWVSFEELDVLRISESTPLTITKDFGGGGDDSTTNVQSNCFYRGLCPIVLVDVAELTPNREEARFDPYVWGSFDNAGTIYAARKLFASEMYAHKMSSN